MWNKREKTVLRIAAVGCIAIIAGLVIGIKSAKGEESLLPDRVVERECMAEAILFEAGNQPIVGKLAVAEVILNRVRSDKYPNTICDVVHEGPIYKWFMMAFFVNFFVLGYVGMLPAEGLYLLIARVGLLYYFGFFFVITPFVGWIEKPNTLPLSISDVYSKNIEASLGGGEKEIPLTAMEKNSNL